MSDIEFLLDDFKEEDKKELHEIEKEINEKPKKVDKNTIFLRKFVLAMMKQYYKPKFKHKDIQDLHQKINISMPDIRKIVPHLLPKPPGKLDVNSFMPKIPTKLNLFGDIPIPNVKEEVKLDLPVKENLNIPKPIVNISVPMPVKDLKVPRPV
ncbi:MAG: hypothetical protein ISS82_04125 [Nanoarchaeota archaeon]|nr:hypothetical protein [Nanoarchaeota archaeon]